jgi:rhodanese-related sulfurtransferase
LDRENHILNIRPLVCYDKIEIIEQAKKIWTYKFSEKIKETCSLEDHSDARIKDFKKIDKIFEELDFDLDDIISNIEEISTSKWIVNSEKWIIESVFTDEVKWEIIDIEKVEQIPTLDKEKEYTFVCSSWYKASQKALKYKDQWYKVYYTLKK